MYNSLLNIVNHAIVQQGSLLKYIWELLFDSESSQLTDSLGDPLTTRELEN